MPCFLCTQLQRQPRAYITLIFIKQRNYTTPRRSNGMDILFVFVWSFSEQVGLSPLSPTPTVSSSGTMMQQQQQQQQLGGQPQMRPMSAMSQPMMGGGGGGGIPSSTSGNNNLGSYANGYLSGVQGSQSGNGMVPTPFTQMSSTSGMMMPNGHAGSGRQQQQQQNDQQQYYWSNQQYPQH